MASELPVHLVSHTHWDREWYLPREQFLLMLVDLVDRVLEILETNPDYRSFMLDGQAIAVEDYLSVKPENADRMKKLIRAGKLLIGPWYVLPDEVLISGESHIRNYLEGQRVCRQFGSSMQIGYLPDSFGHPSQMPQLLTGLGLNEIVFWRGLGPDIRNVEFRWKGIDGTKVLGLNMPQGYGNGVCMPHDDDAFIARLVKKCASLSAMTATGTILIMNGVDHVAPDPVIPEMIKRTNPKINGFELRHSSLPDYVQAVRAKLDPESLEVTGTELRSGYRNYLLGGTLSTRIYLKQENFAAEQLLERQVEPLSTLAWAAGVSDYPRNQMRRLWRLHLQNLPHDSICGCSIDAVHEEMMHRYRTIRQLGESLLDRAFRVVTPAVRLPGDTGTPEPTAGSEEASVAARPVGIIVCNSLLRSRTDVVSCTVDVDRQLTRKVNYETEELEEFAVSNEPDRMPVGAVVIDALGEETPVSIDSIETTETLDLDLDTQPRMHRVARMTLSFAAHDVPMLGYKSYRLRWIYGEADANGSAGPDTAEVENRFFRVRPDGAGTFSLVDKRTGKTWEGLGQIVDDGDAGDEYTYSPPRYDHAVTVDPASVSVCAGRSEGTESLTIGGELRLPVSLSEDRHERSEQLVSCPFILTVSLNPAVPRVDIRVKFRNEARDHRLRLLFPTGLHAQYSDGEGIFAVDKRPIEVPADHASFEEWVEPPRGSHPQKNFVDVSDGRHGLAVANKALPEFQVIQNGEGSVIAITLLRSVGWLSRPDLLARKGNGGWTIPTEGAQCIGEHAFELSVIPHEGNWRRGEVADIAHGFVTPLFARSVDRSVSNPTPEREGSLPPEFSLLTCTSRDIVLSSIKEEEDGDRLIVRLFNLSDERTTTSVVLHCACTEVHELSLDERLVGTVAVSGDGRGVELFFKPWEIKTLAFAITREIGTSW